MFLPKGLLSTGLEPSSFSFRPIHSQRTSESIKHCTMFHFSVFEYESYNVIRSPLKLSKILV
jgi:hypothetical protein